MKHAVAQFSTMQLNLPDAKGIILEDLPVQQPPFTVHWDHLSLDDTIQEFRGVIGQDGELVHVGDFVMLLIMKR